MFDVLKFSVLVDRYGHEALGGSYCAAGYRILVDRRGDRDGAKLGVGRGQYLLLISPHPSPPLLTSADITSHHTPQQAQEYGEVPEVESQNFAKTALSEILPVILNLLLKQDEDADEDEWNVSMAAGTCLGLLATAVCDPIVSGVVPFIEANINGQDWHQREAAVMAFGSILDGPSPDSILPLVSQALPVLIGMLKDPNTHVKDTTAWTLGRICDLASEAIQPDVHLHPLVTGLVGSLGDAPRIVANSCWALMNLADRLEDGAAEGAQTSVLSPYYDGIVQALLKVTETWVLKILYEYFS